MHDAGVLPRAALWVLSAAHGTPPQLTFYLSDTEALILVHCERSQYLGQSLRGGVGPEICMRVYHTSIDSDTRIHSVSQAEKQFKRAGVSHVPVGKAGHRRGLVFVLLFYLFIFFILGQTLVSGTHGTPEVDPSPADWTFFFWYEFNMLGKQPPAMGKAVDFLFPA